MNEISSLKNPLIKLASSLEKKSVREETGLFLIEGEKGVSEAIKDNIQIKNIFVDRDKSELFVNFPENITYKVPEEILKKISTTQTAPPVIAVAKIFNHCIEDMLKVDNPLIIVLEGIKDAGNFGTIIRTAAASGVAGIIVTENSVDMFNPKTVRSAVANLWKIPIVYEKNINYLKPKLNKINKFNFLATKVSNNDKNTVYYDINYKQPTVIMFGSEAEGLSDSLAEIADNFIHIPMEENVESLNLSVSAGVILYESVRQRKFSN
ncbi:MAG: RNA methyltransferase [bacterium]